MGAEKDRPADEIDQPVEPITGGDDISEGTGEDSGAFDISEITLDGEGNPIVPDDTPIALDIDDTPGDDLARASKPVTQPGNENITLEQAPVDPNATANMPRDNQAPESMDFSVNQEEDEIPEDFDSDELAALEASTPEAKAYVNMVRHVDGVFNGSQATNFQKACKSLINPSSPDFAERNALAYKYFTLENQPQITQNWAERMAGLNSPQIPEIRKTLTAVLDGKKIRPFAADPTRVKLCSIGAGGMGETIMVLDTQSGAVETVKQILKERLAGSALEEKRQELTNEFRGMQSSVSSFNSSGLDQEVAVANPKKLLEHDGNFFLVMEYIKGPTLQQVIEDANRTKEGMNIDEALRISMALSGAAAAMGEDDLVHRDLKPANIMMRNGKQPVLIDFGLMGEMRKGEKATGVVKGTMAYMSPEQARGEEPQKCMDVYAVALMAAEMLTGQKPYTEYMLSHLSMAEQRTQTLVMRSLAEGNFDFGVFKQRLEERLPKADVAKILPIMEKALAAKAEERLTGPDFYKQLESAITARTKRIAKKKRNGLIRDVLGKLTLVGVLTFGAAMALSKEFSDAVGQSVAAALNSDDDLEAVNKESRRLEKERTDREIAKLEMIKETYPPNASLEFRTVEINGDLRQIPFKVKLAYKDENEQIQTFEITPVFAGGHFTEDHEDPTSPRILPIPKAGYDQSHYEAWLKSFGFSIDDVSRELFAPSILTNGEQHALICGNQTVAVFNEAHIPEELKTDMPFSINPSIEMHDAVKEKDGIIEMCAVAMSFDQPPSLLDNKESRLRYCILNRENNVIVHPKGDPFFAPFSRQQDLFNTAMLGFVTGSGDDREEIKGLIEELRDSKSTESYHESRQRLYRRLMESGSGFEKNYLFPLNPRIKQVFPVIPRQETRKEGEKE